MISAAFELRLERARTGGVSASVLHCASTTLTVQVVVPDMHVVDPLVSEAWLDGDAFLLHVEDEGEELVHIAGGHIVAVRPLDEGLGGLAASFGFLVEQLTLPLTSRMATGRQG